MSGECLEDYGPERLNELDDEVRKVFVVFPCPLKEVPNLSAYMVTKRPVLFINRATRDWTGVTASERGAAYLQNRFPKFVVYSWGELRRLGNASVSVMRVIHESKRAMGGYIDSVKINILHPPVATHSEAFTSVQVDPCQYRESCSPRSLPEQRSLQETIPLQTYRRTPA
jgi:hypothetical protein